MGNEISWISKNMKQTKAVLITHYMLVNCHCMLVKTCIISVFLYSAGLFPSSLKNLLE